VVTVSDGAVAPLVSHAYGIGLTHTTAGVDAYFTVQARDAAGNNRTTGGDVVVVTVVHERTGHGLVGEEGSLEGSLASSSLSGKEPVAVAYLINGSYRVRYNATRAGNTTVSVTINGVHVDGSPFLPYVSPTVAHAAHCHAQGIGLVSASVSASGSVSAGGGGGHGTTGTTVSTVSNVTVYARDRFGNLLDRGGDQFVVKLVGPTMFFVRLQDMGRWWWW